MTLSTTRPCRKCGSPVPEENAFCTACGAPTTFRPPVEAVQSKIGPAPRLSAASNSTYPAQSVGVPPRVSGIGAAPADSSGMGSVELAHGELVKRVYELGRVQRTLGWVQGTLVVTDTRILYRAEAVNRVSRSTVNTEIQLRDVKGVGLLARRGMSAAGLGAWMLGSFVSFFVVLSLGGGLSALSSLGSDYGEGANYGWLLLFLLIWAIVVITIFVLRRRAAFVVLSVFSSDIDGSPIAVTGSVGKGGGHGILALLASPLILILQRLGVIDADAAADNADLDSIRAVYAELGAVILDLQTRGALGAD